MLIRNATLSLLALAMSASAAWATNSQVAQRQDITLALANDLLSATLAACHADGRTGVAAVVDRGGNLVAVQRDDNVAAAVPENQSGTGHKACRMTADNKI